MQKRSIQAPAAAVLAGTVALALAAGAGCGKLDPIRAPAPVTGSADFSNYVAIGTSVSMGIQSAGIVEDLQQNSFPALLAGVTGANGGNFVQPLVPTPGIPPIMRIAGFGPTGSPIFGVRPGTPPAGPSTPRPADGYDNLGISGAVVANALAKTSGDDPAHYFDLVLQGQGTMVRQCLAQNPTFVTVELGVNDAVRAILGGSDTYATGAAEFQALYTQLLDSLAAGAPNAKLALANVIDVTQIPYATTVPLDVTGPFGPGGAVVTIRLRDAAGPLPNGSLVLLPAGQLVPLGYGFPAPAPPLPDSLVITVAERANIEQRVRDFNTVIAAQAQARGAALADANGLFAAIAARGIVLGGTRYTTRYVSGGLFSLDGVHPNSLGYGLFANEFVRAINARFGASIPPVDLARLQDVPAASVAGIQPAAAARAVDPAALAVLRASLLGE